MTSLLTQAAGGQSPNRPSFSRLLIIPAIPRKLERKLHKNSSLVAGSRSATSTLPEPPVARHISPNNESSPDDPSGTAHGDNTTTSDKQESELKQITTDSTTTEKDAAVEAAQVSPVQDAEQYGPTVAGNPTIPSILDPQTPPFVPEASRTLPQAEDTPSNLNGDNDLPPEQDGPQIPYPLQTIGPWMPYQTTPPDDSTNSPVQQTNPGYSQSTRLFYDPTAPYNHPEANPAVYYGHGQYQNLSFYPQSSQSYASNSPAQSAYEGYAMANIPHVVHSRSHTSSHQRAPSTASRLSHTPMFPPFQPQAQYTRSIPQFGSQMPITPSATPSNSGSQKHELTQPDVVEDSSSVQRVQTAVTNEQDGVTKDISREYKDWCDRTNRTLNEDSNTTIFPITLSKHLIDNFNNPAFADCELYISHKDHRFEPAVVSLHSLLIAQNPKLQELLQCAEIREDGKKQILLAVEDQYTTPTALKSAMRVCYGERPSQYIGNPGKLTAEPEISTTWMNNALAFAAAGHLLGMTGVAHRGEQIASVVLDWHNFEQALSFAMDMRIQRAWGSPAPSSSFPCNASELLLSCLYFIISNTSDSIKLDTAAKPISSIDRLPAVPEAEAQSSRSRLGQIRFGDLPVETVEPGNQHDVLISSVLLSLPFPQLEFILDRLPLPVNRKLAKPLVEERERRRLRALHSLKPTDKAASGEEPIPIQKERVVEKDGEGKGLFSVETVSA